MAAAEIWTLGDQIRKARTNAGMEQAQLADAIGVSRQLVSKWERSKSEPTVSQWRKIAEATGAEWLISSELKPDGSHLRLLPPVLGQMEFRFGTEPVRNERRSASHGGHLWSPPPDARDGRQRSGPWTRPFAPISHGAENATCAQ